MNYNICILKGTNVKFWTVVYIKLLVSTIKIHKGYNQNIKTNFGRKKSY